MSQSIKLERYVVDQEGSIKILDGYAAAYGDLGRAIYGDLFEDQYSEAAFKRFGSFLEMYNVSYYARPKEEFFCWEALELAEKAGASYLIMEDMS